MKVCPVCSEQFENEFSFCDIDGARLTRLREASGSVSESSRISSMLGLGLLGAAILISVAAILFLPRQTATPEPLALNSPPATPSQPIASLESPLPMEPQVPGGPILNIERAVTGETDGTPDQTKETRIETDPNRGNGPTPDPKAALSPRPVIEDVATPPVTRRSEGASNKPGSEARESAADARPTAEKKEPPKPVGASEEKPSDSKKKANDKDSADEKKKGGFLRVFKKIFGKDS